MAFAHIADIVEIIFRFVGENYNMKYPEIILNHK